MKRWDRSQFEDVMMAVSSQIAPAALILVIASASINGIQACRIQALSRQAEELRRLYELQMGETLPSLVSLDVNGTIVTVVPERPERPIVLYWMDPSCTWCRRNEANFRALAANLHASYDVWAVSSTSEGLAEFVAHTAPDYRIVGPPDPRNAAAYKFGATPMTIVLSKDRRVQRIWRGAYGRSNEESIQSLFDVTLPGLLP